ncbi:hypothetical protein CesoFtcFv8_015209 [Champsocephalus esox]|uniref:Uncharacterized protein n=1 Tax=Champsocephalus esox TaxID=159716 RepID=A0AAN8BTK5_9TELE|nr:hypothetical protein CesoFtcFv8_015209 [Champsocephalus esox]
MFSPFESSYGISQKADNKRVCEGTTTTRMCSAGWGFKGTTVTHMRSAGQSCNGQPANSSPFESSYGTSQRTDY